MKYSLLLWVCICYAILCPAQDINTYEETFNWVVNTFEENDAGFQLAVDKKGRPGYEAFTLNIRSRIGEVREQKEFEKLVNEWLGYFRKGHFHFTSTDKRQDEKDTTDRVSLSDTSTTNPYAPSFEKLSPQTLLIRIPTFDGQYKSSLEQLLKENEKLLSSTPNLIIDIHNNGGGTDESFSALIPYLYTNPIRIFDTMWLGSDVSAGEYEQYVSYFTQEGDLEMAEKAREYASKLRKHKGEFFCMEGEPIRIDSSYAVLPYPQKVAILSSGKTGSSAEEFLLTARQSMKVKIFGKPSFGALDISNLTTVVSPDGKYELWYSVSKSSRLPEMPVDGTGIQPDFYLDPTIPQADWVEYVRNILEYK